MNKFKFRVWSILDKKMLSWGEIFHLPAWEIFPGTPDQRAYEVMQYIGEIDKDGIEIYEGDVRRSPNGDVGVIKYFSKYGRFALSNNNTEDVLPMRICNMIDTEFLGTVYENPDLLSSSIPDKFRSFLEKRFTARE